MKKVTALGIGLLMIFALTACGGRGLVDMKMAEIGGKSAIVWDGRTYYPFCVVSKDDRGEQIGYVNGDRDERVSTYQDYPPEEWIVSWLAMDGGAILYKKETVTSIPDGLAPEYD